MNSFSVIILSLLSVVAVCRSSRPVLSKLPPVLDVAQLEAPGPGKCQQDLLTFKLGLESGQPWALTMWDASVKSPVGILSETFVQFGDFDQCLKVTTPITSQYCLLDIHGNSTLWSQFKWGLCLPSSCSARELQASIQTYMDNNAAHVKVELSPQACTTKASTSSEYTSSDVIFSLVFLSIVGIVVAATTYDIILNPEYDGVSPPNTVCQCLSARHGWYSLFRWSQPIPGVDLSAFHGLHFVACFFLVLAHRYAYHLILMTVSNYQIIAEDFYESWWSIWTGHGDLLVDMFCNMSAFMLSLLYMSSLDKQFVSPLYVYLCRVVRLVPPYAMVLFFFSTVLRHFSDGPVWNTVMGLEKECCSSQWWINLLFLNNYVGTDKLCIIPSWFLACDFHWFVLGTLLVLILHRRPTLGAVIIALVFGACTVTLFLGSYLYNRPPYIFFTKQLWTTIRNDDLFNSLHIKSHYRGTSYIPGLIAGAYVYKNRNTVFSERSLNIVQLVGFTTLMGVWWSGWIFYKEESIDQFWAALYGATYHSLFGVGFSMVITTFALGKPTLLTRIFAWRGFVPISKLSYGVYLLHTITQIIWVASLRSTVNMTLLKLLSWTISDVAISLVLSLVLYLTVETPVRYLAKYITSGGLSSSSVKKSKKIH